MFNYNPLVDGKNSKIALAAKLKYAWLYSIYSIPNFVSNVSKFLDREL